MRKTPQPQLWPPPTLSLCYILRLHIGNMIENWRDHSVVEDPGSFPAPVRADALFYPPRALHVHGGQTYMQTNPIYNKWGKKINIAENATTKIL